MHHSYWLTGEACACLLPSSLIPLTHQHKYFNTSNNSSEIVQDTCGGLKLRHFLKTSKKKQIWQMCLKGFRWIS